jgi:subfamily B ATP-binding cassette protein MsbA
MIPDTNKIRRLLSYLKPYWFLEVITFIAMAIIAALAIAVPHALRYMIDDLIPRLTQGAEDGINIGPIIVFALVLICIYVGQLLFALVRDYLAAYIGANIIMTMRSKLFMHLERLSLTFYQKSQVGEIMSRMLSDINRIQSLLTTTLLVFCTNLLLLAAILVYLLHINWLLTLIALIPVPLTMFLTNRFGKKLHQITRMLQEQIARLSARLQETFVAIKTIKAFGQEEAEKKKTDGILSGLTGLYIKASITTSISSQLINLLTMLGPVVLLAWGTYLIAGGSMLLGELMAFYILLTFLYSPIEGLAKINIEIQSAMASVNRVFEYLDIPPAVVEDLQPFHIERAKGEIEFKDVAFSYENSGFRFDGLSFKINPGEKVAIVGPSGSGKTTLVNLIMRFFDPEAGSVYLDGVDLRKLSIKSLRDNVVLVDQDPLLFKTSIFNNIAYSIPDANPDDVTSAAQSANIHDFITHLPEGYNSEVGERGVTLSGGEKQRVCLARAIINNPSVLILDEATSALDSVSEKLIQDALKQFLAGKTAVIVAHRLSTVQNADRIMVMDNGRIIDQGTHQEMIANCPLYQELAKKQTWA